MHSRRCSAVVVLAALTLACRGAAPVAAAVPVAPLPPPPVVAPPTRVAWWAYRPVAERRTFMLSQRAVLTIRQDTLLRVDTLASEAEVTFATAALTGRIAGALTAFRVGTGGADPATPVGLQLPVALAAAPQRPGEQVSISAPAASGPCASTASSLAQGARDLWFRAPDTLSVGTVWSDSASYGICRDGIPIQLRVHREFRVTEASVRDGRHLLSVVRLARTSLMGDGDQFGEKVSVAGTGSGELTYLISPREGELLGAKGTSLLELTFRSALRTQQVRQTSNLTIARPN